MVSDEIEIIETAIFHAYCNLTAMYSKGSPNKLGDWNNIMQPSMIHMTHNVHMQRTYLERPHVQRGTRRSYEATPYETRQRDLTYDVISHGLPA